MQPNGRRRLVESHVEYTFCDDLWKYIKEFAFHQDPKITSWIKQIRSNKNAWLLVYFCSPQLKKAIKDRRKALFPKTTETYERYEKTIEIMLTEPEHQDELRCVRTTFSNKWEQYINERLADPYNLFREINYESPKDTYPMLEGAWDEYDEIVAGKAKIFIKIFGKPYYKYLENSQFYYI